MGGCSKAGDMKGELRVVKEVEEKGREEVKTRRGERDVLDIGGPYRYGCGTRRKDVVTFLIEKNWKANKTAEVGASSRLPDWELELPLRMAG